MRRVSKALVSVPAPTTKFHWNLLPGRCSSCGIRIRLSPVPNRWVNCTLRQSAPVNLRIVGKSKLKLLPALRRLWLSECAQRVKKNTNFLELRIRRPSGSFLRGKSFRMSLNWNSGRSAGIYLAKKSRRISNGIGRCQEGIERERRGEFTTEAQRAQRSEVMKRG